MPKKQRKKSDFPDIPQAHPNQDFEEGWLTPLDTKAARRKRRSVVLAGRKAAERDGAEMPAIPRHLYVVESTNGLVKIGTAFDIELRFDQLQTMSPTELRLAWYLLNGGIALERRLHRYFRHHRSHGEWFSVRPHQVAEVVAQWKVEGSL